MGRTPLPPASTSRLLSKSATALFVLSAALNWHGLAFSQQSTLIPSVPTCDACRITVELVATLGDPDGPGILVSDPVTVTRDSRGYYYVVQFRARNTILVFRENGDFLQRVGTAGRGPGEYVRINALWISRGDTLHIIDGGTHRHTVLSPDWQYVKSSNIEVRAENVVRLPSGRTIVNGTISSPDRIGLPLHTLSADGAIEKSFGSYDDVAAYRGDLPYLIWRRLAPAGSASVWAAPPNRYVVERWDTSGTRVAELVRAAEWFEPYIEQPIATPDDPSPPWLTAIHYDPTPQRLWISILVPSPEWAQRLGPPIQTPAGKRYRVSNPNIWDTVVEIVDTGSGNLFASSRISPAIYGFLANGQGYAYREDEAGIPFIDVWRLRLQQNAKGGEQ